MNNTTMDRKQGFTLVELVMVIAILALIATLAISRLSGVRLDSEKKLNVANLTRIGTALDTFMTANDGALNRLDGLLKYDEPLATAGSFDVSVFPDELSGNTNVTGVVLNSRLIEGASAYGGFPGLLARYYLTDSDVTALNNMGLSYVMRGTDNGRFTTGDDGAWSQGTAGDPDTASCVAKQITNGFAVAVINPGGVVGTGSTISPLGARVYESCGQDVFFTTSAKLLIDDTEYDPGTDAALQALLATNGDGILLAFGVGQFSSFVGSNRAGLDSAPICPVITAKDEYRRYIVLLRLRHTGTGSVVEYAGVMDALGQPIMEARAAVD
ncbi:MAG: type II secretion system GspH family protein [Verrucomicrobiota bacterium]|jgi:type IV pilus assembly protein PilA|nr:type II secretion system GspH family protein [Verrucomicrobiota bacterium]